eukprot:CFRG3331T1
MPYNEESRMSFHNSISQNAVPALSMQAKETSSYPIFEDELISHGDHPFWRKVRHGTPMLCIPIFIISFSEKVATISMSATSYLFFREMLDFPMHTTLIAVNMAFTAMFGVMAIAGFVSDLYLSRYKVILYSMAFLAFSLGLLFISSTPLAFENYPVDPKPWGKSLALVGMLCAPLAAAWLKVVLLPFALDQRLNKEGSDTNDTTQAWFLVSNVGSFLALLVLPVTHHFAPDIPGTSEGSSFWLTYIVVMSIIAASLIFFLVPRRYYIKRVPRKTAVVRFYACLRMAWHNRNMNASLISRPVSSLQVPLEPMSEEPANGKEKDDDAATFNTTSTAVTTEGQQKQRPDIIEHHFLYKSLINSRTATDDGTTENNTKFTVEEIDIYARFLDGNEVYVYAILFWLCCQGAWLIPQVVLWCDGPAQDKFSADQFSTFITLGVVGVALVMYTTKIRQVHPITRIYVGFLIQSLANVFMYFILNGISQVGTFDDEGNYHSFRGVQKLSVWWLVFPSCLFGIAIGMIELGLFEYATRDTIWYMRSVAGGMISGYHMCAGLIVVPVVLFYSRPEHMLYLLLCLSIINIVGAILFRFTTRKLKQRDLLTENELQNMEVADRVRGEKNL